MHWNRDKSAIVMFLLAEQQMRFSHTTQTEQSMYVAGCVRSKRRNKLILFDPPHLTALEQTQMSKTWFQSQLRSTIQMHMIQSSYTCRLKDIVWRSLDCQDNDLRLRYQLQFRYRLTYLHNDLQSCLLYLCESAFLWKW